MNDVLSPELVLVSSPEARARAIADLPALLVVRPLPLPRPSRFRLATAGLVTFIRVATIALTTTFAVVLVLTIVADALR
jgi:hypothetical protein